MKPILTPILALLVLCGCGLKVHGFNYPIVSLDGVKLISAEIADGQESTTFGQESYQLGENIRLLLRFEGLIDDASQVVSNYTSDPSELYLYCEGDSSCNTLAQAKLHLCPLTRDWMMLATWTVAHPFGSAGRWNTAGGDLDLGGCVQPVTEPVDPAAKSPTAIRFDIKAWVSNYLHARERNDGWALLLKDTNEKISIYGEKSGSYSPRLIY